MKTDFLRNRTLKNVFWLFGGQFVRRVLVFLVGILSARYLGPDNFGLINYCAAYLTFFASLCTLGIDSVILKFKKRYPTRSIDADIPDTLLLIPMDPMLIEQVIFNILENAEQHAKGFTKLSLRVFTSDGNAVFEIADNGCGIAKERLDGLFLGYAGKLADSSDSGKRNLGIGLSVCATIVKAHGGSISAENAKSGGAIFRFSLPLEEVSHEQ
jgi:K+-sensing histidine kinase KdpD